MYKPPPPDFMIGVGVKHQTLLLRGVHTNYAFVLENDALPT
jgi:hypothetical protein